MTPGVVSYWCQTAPIPSVLIKAPLTNTVLLTRPAHDQAASAYSVFTKVFYPQITKCSVYRKRDESPILKTSLGDVNCRHAAKWEEL